MIDEKKCVCAKNHCKYYWGHVNRDPDKILFCAAFPDGIPDDIASGKIKHDSVIEGQFADYTYYKGVDMSIIKPYLTRNMVLHTLHGTDALCTIFHDIYIQTNNPIIKRWCCMAMRMSKNCHVSLQEYQTMLVKLGITEVENDSRIDWQQRPKDLYREIKKKNGTE